MSRGRKQQHLIAKQFNAGECNRCRCSDCVVKRATSKPRTPAERLARMKRNWEARKLSEQEWGGLRE